MLAQPTLGPAARSWSWNVEAAPARCNDLERTHFGDLCLGVGTCATLARRNLFLCGLEAAARRTSSGGPQIGTLPQKHTPTVHPEMGCRGREPWRTLVKDFTPAHSADLQVLERARVYWGMGGLSKLKSSRLGLVSKPWLELRNLYLLNLL